jgi:hypothetical protein
MPYGSHSSVLGSLDAEGQEALARDRLEDRNTSGDGTIVVPSDYLEAVAVRR